MRAFRPSQFASQDEVAEEVEEAKQANVRKYVTRAQAGLPLFGTDSQPIAPSIPQVLTLVFPRLGRFRYTSKESRQ